MTGMTTEQILRKFPANKWEFDYQPDHERWVTYRIPIDWPFGLHGWLWELGNPLSDLAGGGPHSNWDYRGGWIYFYDEKLVTAFLLKWS